MEAKQFLSALEVRAAKKRAKYGPAAARLCHEFFPFVLSHVGSWHREVHAVLAKIAKCAMRSDPSVCNKDVSEEFYSKMRAALASAMQRGNATILSMVASSQTAKLRL